MLVYKIATILALIVTAAWAINKPAYDSVSAAIVAFAAFVFVFFVDQKRARGNAGGQSQEVGPGGAGIQAGRDANNANINKKN